MSNVRCLNTEVHARKAVAHLKHRAGLVHRCKRQQEAVQEAKLGGVERSCNARTVPRAARPLAVGSRPWCTERPGIQDTICRLPASVRSSRIGSATQVRLTAPGRTARTANCGQSPESPPPARQCSARPSPSRFSQAQCSVLLAALRGTAAPKSRVGVGASEYARAKWRRSASAARMHHATVAGI